MWNARADHYIRNTRSLCGRWMYLGTTLDNKPPGPNACAACLRKFNAERAKVDPTQPHGIRLPVNPPPRKP